MNHHEITDIAAQNLPANPSLEDIEQAVAATGASGLERTMAEMLLAERCGL